MLDFPQPVVPCSAQLGVSCQRGAAAVSQENPRNGSKWIEIGLMSLDLSPASCIQDTNHGHFHAWFNTEGHSFQHILHSSFYVQLNDSMTP